MLTEKRKVGGSTPPLPTLLIRLKDPERRARGLLTFTHRSDVGRRSRLMPGSRVRWWAARKIIAVLWKSRKEFLMGGRTYTLIATQLGDMAPGRPADWNQLPPDARAWAERQAAEDNEMLTILDGDHRAALGADYDVYLVTAG
jgi:hypothetical protein